MPRYNRQEDFESGLAELTPLFDSLGFTLSRGRPVQDREGTSYSARFVRASRSVELNHLYSLGPVVYSIREFSLEHTVYLEAIGAAAAARFPAFADDSTSGYRALLADLGNLLDSFFTGPEEDFIALAAGRIEKDRVRQHSDARVRSYHAAGEDRLKARARELFFQGDYDKVARMEAQIRFPELLTKSERGMFALARKRKRGGT